MFILPFARRDDPLWPFDSPLFHIQAYLFKANLKSVSHIFSTRGITTSVALRSTVGGQRSFLFLLFCTLSAEYTFRH